MICLVFYYCMPRIDLASSHFVCTLFGVSCRDNLHIFWSWILPIFLHIYFFKGQYGVEYWI